MSQQPKAEFFVSGKITTDWEGSEYKKRTECVLKKASQPQGGVKRMNQYEAREEERAKKEEARRQRRSC